MNSITTLSWLFVDLCPLRLRPLACGLEGQFCALGSCCGSVPAGSLRCPAQPDGLGPGQTGPADGAGGPEQDSLLLHYCTRPPGTTALPKSVKYKAFSRENMFPVVLLMIKNLLNPNFYFILWKFILMPVVMPRFKKYFWNYL